ncbi:right-handed parallel beta-helix repeat-containing protein [Gandjariella thermophila]|uniref:right-handed parallel beta-helix repeat-containing protein n=1 Tax=Gandjariella thermophila TaxID=1931992 RepID=UPI001CEF5B9A|nr:right-handed parallel beta-helix repeat-containing protein [Gandjariella thermophila]
MLRTAGGRWRAALLAVLAPLVVAGCSTTPEASVAPTVNSSGSPAPAAAAVCDRMPPGPTTAPAGAVTVDPAVPGDLAAKTQASPAGTTFWLAPGTHRLPDDRYAQVTPKDGDTYLGAPGAVLDGRRINQYAFAGAARDVTIRNLTVQGFVAPRDEGVVNHDSADGWVVEHSTIQHNAGAGLMAGAHQRVRGDCLRGNGQYGMNAYQERGGITGLVVEGNEIVGNNADDWESREPGCGCTGGVKFWAVDGADVRGNWVHDNRGAGLWADTDDNDFLVEGNLIEANDGAAIIYEASYNAVIRNNTIRRNNWVDGRRYADRGDSFPVATVYVSESGGEPRVRARTDRLDISANTLEDNWSGITLWENADRFCNSPANTSSGSCTLLVPDRSRCTQPAIDTAPLRDDCRWKTQRVDIHGNRFTLDTSVVGCEVTCGRMALLANFGSYPDWSPYRGDGVEQAIIARQDNRWHDNAYVGPWTFVAHDTSQVLDHLQWQAAPYQQDQGSTFTRGGG